MLVDGAGADDAHVGVAHLDAVEVGRLGELDEALRALVHHEAALDGVGRHHDELADVVDVGTGLDVDAVVRRGDHRAGVSHAHGLVEHDRRVELLRQLEGPSRHVAGLLRIRHVEAGDAREGGVVAGVLLVLGRVARGVIGGENDETAVDAGVAHRHERVGGHVDAHVLHGRDGAHPSHGGTRGDLERDLLVGCPLAVDAVVGHE